MTRFSPVVVLASVAFAQQPKTPAFEVASVKVSAPVTPGRGATGAGRCVKPNPGTVNCTNANLKLLLTQAYGVAKYQIEGPAWLDANTYDVMAKVPAGTPGDQVPAMLQTLLAQRFHMAVHKVTKPLDAFEMTVAPGGPKLKAVDPAEVAAARNYQAAIEAGRTDVPRPSTRGVGAMSIKFNPTGARTLNVKMSMPEFANYLISDMGKPVLDRTGLKGTYDIEVTYLAGDSDLFQRGFRSEGKEAPPDASTPTATLPQAIEKTLGLKLHLNKIPIEIVIVDSANKVPSEN